MKVKDRAIKDLTKILTLLDENLTAPPEEKITLIAHQMGKLGWAIPEDTLLETARSLGFPVIGQTIYQIED